MAAPVYSEETFFYEVLLRFGEVAPNKGTLIGASLTQLTQLLKDGVLLNTTINPPEQLALVDGEDGQKLSDVLGTVNAATIIENQTLQASVSSLQGQLGAANDSLSTEQAKTVDLEAQLAVAKAEIERLNGLIPNVTPADQGSVADELGSV